MLPRFYLQDADVRDLIPLLQVEDEFLENHGCNLIEGGILHPVAQALGLNAEIVECVGRSSSGGFLEQETFNYAE